MEGVTGARKGWRGGAWTARSRVVSGGIGMLGQRQVTPRWTDDPVRRHVRRWWECRGRRGLPPPEENQEVGIVGGEVQVNKYLTISDRA